MTTQHQLFSDTPSEKELSKCYTCEYGLHKIAGGGNKKYYSVDGEKNGVKYKIRIGLDGDKYKMNLRNLENKKVVNSSYKNINDLKKELGKYSIKKYAPLNI